MILAIAKNIERNAVTFSLPTLSQPNPDQFCKTKIGLNFDLLFLDPDEILSEMLWNSHFELSEDRKNKGENQ